MDSSFEGESINIGEVNTMVGTGEFISSIISAYLGSLLEGGKVSKQISYEMGSWLDSLDKTQKYAFDSEFGDTGISEGELTL